LQANLSMFPNDLIIIGPRIEPHIQMKYVSKYTCENKFITRSALDSAFVELDNKLQNIFFGSRYISLQKLIKFSIDRDFINCSEIYWSDGDHWSVAGEKKFSQLLKDL